ncbi:hypothetical protein PALI_a1109 [Pseudoalteromonas aliena SW19]|uniref:Uncharacterized protein n=1 Tax=Pseudoalteromonas aliena SW19 TaxID=1314866 RepID=A0ABR9E089_9GAMM|nr:hypothetical protein [Pseudoalteromonas aliena SW19]
MVKDSAGCFVIEQPADKKIKSDTTKKRIRTKHPLKHNNCRIVR